MAGKPHDMTGRRCSLCGLEFTKKSVGCNEVRKVKNFIVHIKVCITCKEALQRGKLCKELEDYIGRLFGGCSANGSGPDKDGNSGNENGGNCYGLGCPWRGGEGLRAGT